MFLILTRGNQKLFKEDTKNFWSYSHFKIHKWTSNDAIRLGSWSWKLKPFLILLYFTQCYLNLCDNMRRVIFYASLQLPEEWPRGYYRRPVTMFTLPSHHDPVSAVSHQLILLSSHQLAKPNVHCASMWPMSTVYSSLSAMTLGHKLIPESDPCIVAPVSKLQSSVLRYVTRKDVTGSTLRRRHFKYEFQEP